MSVVFNFIVFACAIVLIVLFLSRSITEKPKKFPQLKWESRFKNRHLKIVKKDINK